MVGVVEAQSLGRNVGRVVIQLVQKLIGSKMLDPVFRLLYIEMGGLIPGLRGGGKQQRIGIGTHLLNEGQSIRFLKMLDHFYTGNHIVMCWEIRGQVFQGRLRSAIGPDVLRHLAYGVFRDVDSICLYPSVPQRGNQSAHRTADIQKGFGMKILYDFISELLIKLLEAEIIFVRNRPGSRTVGIIIVFSVELTIIHSLSSNDGLIFSPFLMESTISRTI